MGLFESVVGGVLGGGLPVLGALSDAGQQRQQQRHSDDMQRVAWERDDQAIRRRVADAKAAGLHPLYALGASVPSSSTPTYVGGAGDTMSESMGRAGQNISDVIARASSDDADMKRLEKGLLMSQIGETDARRVYYLSEAARAGQGGNNGLIYENPVVEGQSIGSSSIPKELQGMVQIKPREIPSPKVGQPHVTAGIDMGYDEIQLAPGFYIMFPQGKEESWREIYNEMPPWDKYGLWQQNKEVYGENWVNDFVEYFYGGKKPPGNYIPLASQSRKFKPRYADPEGFWEDKMQKGEKFFQKWFSPKVYEEKRWMRGQHPRKRG